MASDSMTCRTCDRPNVKIIGTVSVSGRGVSGSLKLAVHRDDNTGKTCKGMDSMVLVRFLLDRRR